MQNTNSAAVPATLAPQKSILTFSKSVFSTPLFLALLICFTITLGVNVAAIIMHHSPMGLFSALMASGSAQLTQAFAVYGENTIISQLVAVLPNVIMLAGLWIVFFNAATASNEKIYRIGFTAVQVVRFNMLIITGLMLLTLDMHLIRTIDAEGIANGLALTYKIGIIVASLLIVFYNFKVLAMFSFIKETVCENSPITQISILVALFCIIWGGTYALTTVFYGIELGAKMIAVEFILPAAASLLQCVSAILFGCYILVYRSKIRNYVTE